MPPGVFGVHIRAVGAMGGPSGEGSSGGRGAVIDADFPAWPGTTVYAVVGGAGTRPEGPEPGGGGFNGGGNGQAEITSGRTTAGGGGGASDVRLDPANVETRILVAAGGGGAAYGGAGGAAGRPGASSDWSWSVTGGEPGGETAGGAGGNGPRPGEPGTLAAGGSGGIPPSEYYRHAPGGGGGGGLFGGGGGGAHDTDPLAGGGGGGSSMSLTGSTPGLAEDRTPASVTITYRTPQCVGSVCFDS